MLCHGCDVLPRQPVGTEDGIVTDVGPIHSFLEAETKQATIKVTGDTAGVVRGIRIKFIARYVYTYKEFALVSGGANINNLHHW